MRNTTALDMENAKPVHVFVSYAHADTAVQQAFERQLVAAERLGAFSFWADTKLEPGQNWDAAIREHIAAADVALLLVSTAFLSSKYIGVVEEPLLTEGGRRVFWVKVGDCPWELSRLKDLQACGSIVDLDPPRLNASANSLVLEIAKAAKEIEQTRSPIQQVMAQYVPACARLLSNFKELGGGRHCWVHGAQAALGDAGTTEPVVVKVLLKNPFENLTVALKTAAERAVALEHPCFIRLRRHYLDERFPVLLMDAIDQRVLRDVLRADGPFPPDGVRDRVAMAAEALAELHDAGGTYGILTSNNVFLDQKTDRLRFSALSLTGLLSQVRDWREFLGIDPSAATYMIPEQFKNEPLSPYSDQYVLGQIALEMITGQRPLPGEIADPMDLARRSEFFAEPLHGVTVAWLPYHPAFAAVLERLLDANPQKRFPNMHEAADALRDLDDQVVAYARYAYGLACDQPGFFDEFYHRFLEACPEARTEFAKGHGPHAGGDMATQSRVLQAGLVAVLGAPETLRKNLASMRTKHRAIPPEFFGVFVNTFVTTLRDRFPALPDFVLTAWTDVLTRAIPHITGRAAGPAGPP